MFAKGKIRGNGAQLARYLMTGEESERVELVETRGLEAFGRDPAAAFAALQNVADANTQSTKPFFHGHIRLPADERLTDAQWMQTLELMEMRLGFEGQPRIVTFHHLDQNGDKHLHVGWFRIDLETMRAIDPGLYKNDLRELCREQERAYGLRQLDNEGRKPQGHEPSQNEVEEARRLGTDVREIRAAIVDCFQRSDTGRAFKTALEERGLMLANGDRRDCFVVIDQAGGQHALNKKLTGMTLAAIRERFADLDRSQLPGVEQAQEMQRNRQAERTTQPEAANQNVREPMTLEAITRDPWKAVDLEIPRNADPALLAAVALSADLCAKAAFAHGRVAVIIAPERADLYRERHDSAAARRDEARSALAQLPPEQRKLSRFPDRGMQETALYNITGSFLYGASSTEPVPTITATEIDRNPWNVLSANVSGASADLLLRVFDTAVGLQDEALRRRDEAYTPTEATLWNDIAGEAKETVKAAQTELGQFHGPSTTFNFEQIESPGRGEITQPELAATADAAVDHAAQAGEGISRNLGKMFASVINWLSDLVAPAPPLTREQGEREARAAEQRRQQQAFDQAEQQQHALQQFLNAETIRTQQTEAERDPRLAEMMNLHTQASARRPESEADRERDRD